MLLDQVGTLFSGPLEDALGLLIRVRHDAISIAGDAFGLDNGVGQFAANRVDQIEKLISGRYDATPNRQGGGGGDHLFKTFEQLEQF